MKVVIKEREYDYLSDYPNGWLFASGDPYKFPVDIGKYSCFVKRFEKKRPDDISGWDLLVQLKGRFDPNLPRIYDVVEVEENNKRIHYIFYEFLAGQTLEAAINRNADIDLLRLTQDLFNAAQALHARSFWFSDFCEKNIFMEANGRFLLIDLDSVQPLAEPPHNNMYGDKQYWALVFKFYREQLGYRNLKPGDINGAILNYLQIIFLIMRLKLVLQDKRYDYKSTELHENLPGLLQDTDPGFQELFEQALSESTESQVTQIASATKDLIIRHIINNDQVPYQPTRRMPEIVAFKISDTLVKPGQTFTLSWEVVDATQLALYRNGDLFQELRSDTKTLELKENYDGRPKKVTYTLQAASRSGEQKSDPVTVTISEPAIIFKKDPIQYKPEPVDKQTWPIKEEEPEPKLDYQPEEQERDIPITPRNPAPEPKILNFQVDNAQVIGGQKITLNWEVEYATEVELYRNDQLYSNILGSQGSLNIKEDYDATATAVTYYLVAINKHARTSSEVLSISIIQPITPNPDKLRYIRLAVALLFLAIAGIAAVVVYSIFFRKEIKVLSLRGNLTEGEVLGIMGENFPDQTDKVQVFFNAIPGKVMGVAPDSMRVLVPPLNTAQDSSLVRLTLLVSQDTVYTAGNLVVKKKTFPQNGQSLQTKLNNLKPQTDSLVKDKEVDKTEATTQTVLDQGNKKPGNSEESEELAYQGIKKPNVPKKNTYRPKNNTLIPKPPVKPEPIDYPAHPPVDIYKLVTVKSNVIANQRRQGTKNLQITVQNSSAYDLDHVRVEVEYQRRNGKSLAKEYLNFVDVRAHTSQTLAAPDNEKGRKVDFKIVSIDSKQLK